MFKAKVDEFIHENGFMVSHEVAYGYFDGYLITIGQTPGIITVTIPVYFDEDQDLFIDDYLNDDDFTNKYPEISAAIKNNQVIIYFDNKDEAVERFSEAMSDIVYEMHHQIGIPGGDVCPRCGQRTGGFDDTYLVNGVAMKLHQSCMEAMNTGFAENAEAAKTSGSVLTGAVGATVGAIVGAIPWAVVSFLGWFVGYLGFLISFVSCKGYELLHGKETKVKGIIVLVVSLVAVVLAEYVAMLASLMKEYPGTPLSTCFVALNEAIRYEPEMQAIVVKDLLMGWLFAVLGMYSTIKQIFTNVKRTTGGEIIRL